MKHVTYALLIAAIYGVPMGCSKQSISLKTSPATPAVFQTSATYTGLAGDEATAEPAWTRFKVVATNNTTENVCISTIRVTFTDPEGICEFVATEDLPEDSSGVFFSLAAGATATSTQSFYCTAIGDEDADVNSLAGTIEALGWTGDCNSEDADKSATGDAIFSASN